MSHANGLLDRLYGPRRRLIVALAAGVVAAVSPPYGHSPTVRGLVAWSVGTSVYLLLVHRVIRRADADETRQRCTREDPGRYAIDAILTAASAASLVAVFYALHESGQARTVATFAITAVAIVAATCSWVLTHTLYAIHYARLYYHPSADGAEGEPLGGLDFNCDEPPDFRDFCYYAFAVSTTFGATDVRLTNHHMRRTTMAHSLISFAYATINMGLVVNVVGTMLSSK